MKRFIGATLLLPILLVSTFITPSTANAQESAPFYWEFINVDIDVQENGDMWITEKHKYVFTGPYTNELYHRIPLDKVDSIDNVQVFEEDNRLPAKIEVEDKQLCISWQHEIDPQKAKYFSLNTSFMVGFASARRANSFGGQRYQKTARQRSEIA